MGNISQNRCDQTRRSQFTNTEVVSRKVTNDLEFWTVGFKVSRSWEVNDRSVASIITISIHQLKVIHLKVSEISQISLCDAICILKASQLMVRETWICFLCKVFIVEYCSVSIKETELPEVTTTSYTKDSRSINIGICRIRNIQWSDLSLS